MELEKWDFQWLASYQKNMRFLYTIDQRKKSAYGIKNIKPIMPVNADLLMEKYKIPEGKQLGDKLRIIEDKWVKNNFRISDEDVDSIVNS